MQLNLPTYLTLLRILLIPVFVGMFYMPVSWANVACTALFGIAAVTDWLDGYLARRLQQTSAFGAFLDPVADKLIVAVALVLLVQDIPTPGVMVLSHHSPPSTRRSPLTTLHHSLSTRMKLLVHRLQSGHVHVGVDLCGGDTGVAEHLLDLSEVGAAGEHVGGKAVAHGVRADGRGGSHTADVTFQ